MKLRDYQEKYISDLRAVIKQGHSRILLQAHVGAGKTIISGEISRLATEKFKKVLFIAPRRQLVYQAVDKFLSLGVNCGIIMAGESRFNQPLVQVASKDTLLKRIASGRMEYPNADIVIVDEAHYSFTKGMLDFLKKYPLVIGITATPALANGKGMGAFYTAIVEGPSMAEMVNNGYLVPMKYFGADAPDLTGVKLNSDGDYIEKDLAEAVDKPDLIGGIYQNYRRIAGDRTTLIFAVNRSHARHIHDEFLNHGVDTEYLDGDTEKEERKEMEQRVMSGKTKVVVNIGVMAFGGDWPRISCVIVARPTKNICSWIQMIGRGSRLFYGKSDCSVIYHGDNFQELGMIDEPITWSLDDVTIKERKQAAQKERKEPKEITCPKCKVVFKSRRDCPSCGFQVIPKGEAIPVYEADLKEIKREYAPKDKSDWYAQLLGYAKKHGKSESFALAMFRSKFNEWPYNKYSIKPIEPTKMVVDYVISRNIAYSRRKNARTQTLHKAG